MGDVGHIGRCPFVAAILHALLCVPALRLDEGFTLDSSAPAARSISKAARGAPSRFEAMDLAFGSGLSLDVLDHV